MSSQRPVEEVRPHARIELVPLLAGTLAIAVGAVVFVAWLLDLDDLKRLISGYPQMKANTALAVIALGAATLLLRRGQSRSRLRAGRATALAVALFGAVALGEYLFGRIGIDELLFEDPGPTPGRPAPHTAVAFFLLGAALATIDTDLRRLHPSTWLLGGAAAVVLSALLGYAYEVDFLRATSGTTGVALPTALGLTALTAGIACLRPDRGLVAYLRQDDPGAATARRLLPAIVLLPLVFGFARLQSEALGLDEAVGVGLTALATMGVFLVLVLTVSRRLSRADVDRASAEAATAEALTRYRALLEATPDPTVVVDAAGKIAHANRLADETFGYAPDELAGHPVELLLPERFRDLHHGHRAAFAATPRARPMGEGRELFARRRDGSELPVEISLSPVQTQAGQLVIAAIRDITERKRSEEARRRAEEQFTQAFEHAPIGMALTGLDGSFLSVNQALCDLTGYSAGQLQATRLETITHPDDADAELAERRRIVAGDGSSYHGEARFISSQGEPIPVDISMTLVRGAHGEPSHFVSQVVDMSERKRFEGQLQYLADHDPLTGLFNRRRFSGELTRELALAARYSSRGALLALDLDHFKYVNDSLGHSFGDELITRIASIVKHRLRETDVFARLGGDEFAIVLPRVDQEQAVLVATQLLEAIRLEGVLEGGRRVTASIGVAMFDGPSRVTAEELMVEADIALYDAKEAGRDRAAVFDSDTGRQERMHASLAWSDRIRRALDSDGFVLHAQPILALDGDRIPRYELLIRMRGEDGDLIPPGTFLYVAERFEMIQEIDRWVLRESIRLLAEQQRAGRDVRFEMNLSAKSVSDSDLPDLIASQLREAGADPRGLCVEITETAAIVNVDRAKVFARRVRELGCEFALDDFGAGFASFYYLKHLDFDFLKIDGEFIQGLAQSRVNQLVVAALVQIAKGLGKRTIAEFVGDEQTLDLLRRFGVDYAQGFHIAEPGPIELDGAGRPARLPQLERSS